MVAIISRAVYDRDFADAKLGTVAALHQYVSTNAALTKLSQGGRLFLLSVRPPNEALWLMGVLVQPRFTGTLWEAAPNVVPVTDVSSLRSRLRFENGKGLPAEAGKLGMSLQTPRVLRADDVALFEEVLREPKLQPGNAAQIILNEHHTAAEPCLCKRCLPSAPEEYTAEGQRFVRRWVSAKGRALHFWVPFELADEPALLSSVRGTLLDKLERRPGRASMVEAAAKKDSAAPQRVSAPEPTPVQEADEDGEEEAPYTAEQRAKDLAEERPAKGVAAWFKRLFGG